MAERWTISIDRDACMGSGMCMVYAPNTFALDAEAKSTVINPSGDPLDDIRTAVGVCPTNALELVLDDEA
jgi:ferredoxin